MVIITIGTKNNHTSRIVYKQMAVNFDILSISILLEIYELAINLLAAVIEHSLSKRA